MKGSFYYEIDLENLETREFHPKQVYYNLFSRDGCEHIKSIFNYTETIFHKLFQPPKLETDFFTKVNSVLTTKTETSTERSKPKSKRRSKPKKHDEVDDNLIFVIFSIILFIFILVLGSTIILIWYKERISNKS